METNVDTQAEADTMGSEKETLEGRGSRPSAPTETTLNLDCRRIKDLRLIKRAVQGNWNVSPVDRPIIVEKVVAAIKDKNLSDRHRLTAIDCIVLMSERSLARIGPMIDAFIAGASDESC